MAPRKNSRRSSRRTTHGGANESLNQGAQFRELLPQGGGAYTELHGAPVGDQGLLDGNLREMARVGPLDVSIADAARMRDPDQSGGGRSRKNTMRKSRKNAMRKSRKNAMRKSRKNAMRKSRKSERKSRKSARKSRSRKAQRKSRKAQRKSRKSARKSRKSARKSRKSARKSRSRKAQRKMFGGSASYAGAPIAQDSMLLSRADAARAGTADFSNPLLKH